MTKLLALVIRTGARRSGSLSVRQLTQVRDYIETSCRFIDP